jgi:hypothetical protein
VPYRRLTLREDECEALPASPLYSTPDKTPQTSPMKGHAPASSTPTLNAAHHNHAMRRMPLDHRHFSQADP